MPRKKTRSSTNLAKNEFENAVELLEKTLTNDNLKNEKKSKVVKEKKSKTEKVKVKKSGKERPVKKSKQSKEDQDTTENSTKIQVNENQNTVESNEEIDITVMRKIFFASQHVQKCQKCVQSLYKLIKEIEFEVFYEEFCRNVKCSLQQDYENPKVKCILDMVALFLISVKNENLLKNKINEDTLDEIGLELFGKNTFEASNISRTYKNLLDYLMSDALIPFLNSINTSTRLNTLYLIRKILLPVQDIELSIYERLKTTLLDRLLDKNANVRLSAAYALHRFQDVTDPKDNVFAALQFHLKNDTAASVRSACLNVIVPTKYSLPDVILRTRDINPKIRELAYSKISKKVDFKTLSVENRMLLFNNAFKEREDNVKNVIENQLISSWVKSYNEKYIDLLADLEISSNAELINKFLNIIFKKSLSFKVENRTKFHLLVERFKTEYLDDNIILNENQITQEACIFWRCLGSFLKKNEEEILKYSPDLEKKINLKNEINSLLDAIDVDINESQKVLNSTKIPSNQSLINKELNETLASNIVEEVPVDKILENNKIEETNPLDLIIPNLSLFVAFFKNFCIQVNNEKYDPEDLLEFEFIFKELCLFLDNYDIVDGSQKQLVINLAEEIILLDELGNKFDEYIQNIMKFLSLSVLKTNEDILDYTVEITNKVESSLEEEELKEDLPVIDPKEIRKLELTFAREAVGLHDLKDKLDEALAKREYDIAHGHQLKIDVVEETMAKIKNEINKLQNISIRQKPEPEIEIDIKDHPSVHLKLLQIFGCCLRYGSFRNLTSIMDTRIQKYILPGIVSTDSKIRYYALKALNQACYISSSLAARFYALYHEICTKDNEHLQVCALQGLIDSLVEHGLQILYSDIFNNSAHSDTKNEEETQIRKMNDKNSVFSTKHFTQESSFLNRSEITTPDISFVDSEQDDQENQTEEKETLVEDKDENETDQDKMNLTLKSKIIDPNKTAEQIEQEDEIIKQLTKFLLKFTRSDVEEIKSTSVMGICKLLLLGRIYSPLLLSELILLWYNSSTSLSLQHDIGTFLPIYCFASATYKIEIPENYSGQYCLLECFISTVENVYRLERGEQLEVSFELMRSNYYDVDLDGINIIDFMLNLLEPKNHSIILKEFLEKTLEILKIPRDDDFELREPFLSKYLMKSLTLFKLNETSKDELNNLLTLIKEIQFQPRYNTLKKNNKLKVEKLLQLIEIFN